MKNYLIDGTHIYFCFKRERDFLNGTFLNCLIYQLAKNWMKLKVEKNNNL